LWALPNIKFVFLKGLRLNSSCDWSYGQQKAGSLEKAAGSDAVRGTKKATVEVAFWDLVVSLFCFSISSVANWMG
jgi:hypothetical protein